VNQFVQNARRISPERLSGRTRTAEEIFQKILDTPGGVKIGAADTENNLSRLEHTDKKIHVHFPEMESWVKEVAAHGEEALLVNKEYPMILMAGNHMDMVANANMRDPAWNEGRRACTMRIHPPTLRKLGSRTGRRRSWRRRLARHGGSRGSRTARTAARSSFPRVRLVHMEKIYGVNANRLTSAKNRIAWRQRRCHRYIPAGSQGSIGLRRFFGGH